MRYKNWILFIAAVSGCLPWAASHADEPVALEEIVVTARRREESLANTPVAVTALSASQLQVMQINTLDKIADHVPNLTFQPGAPTGGGVTTPSVFIRGVGSAETSLGTQPGVGLYVDDVYIARSIGSVLDLIDVASIQVLRGPQGTLFGRNNIGGAIVIRSTPVARDLAGSIELVTGNDHRRDIQASIDVPFSDTVRARVAGISAYRDGYVTNLDADDSDEDFGSTDRTGAAVAFEWDASENFKLTLRGDLTRARETAAPSVLLGLVETIPGTTTPSMIQAVSNLQGTCFGASVLGNSGNPDCIDQQFILGAFQARDGYVTQEVIFDSQGSEPFANRTKTDIGGASATMEWNINDGLTLKSITAWRETDAFWPSNSDHSANPGIETKVDFDHRQFSQELQLLGDSFGGSFRWIAGAYYLDEKGEELNVVAFPAVIFRSGGGYTTESTAVFAQGSYDVSEKLELTAGARYTHERKTYDTLSNQEIIGVLLDPFTRTFLDLRATPVPFVTGDTPPITGDEVTPYASINYRWTPDVMSYLSYSEGYKSGGYEQRLAPGTPEVPRFDPEYLRMFELGLKSTLLEGRMSLAAALFHADYTDMQITVVDGVAPTMTNAGDATIQGAELEIAWRPVPGFILNANAGYIDAHYDRLTERALNSGVTLDNALPNTPEFQAAVGAQYGIDLGEKWSLTPRVDWAHRSFLYVDSANSPLLRQDDVSLLNASLSLATRDDRWLITLSGRNLTDEAYLVSGLAQYSIGEIEGQYARPREWNLSLMFSF